MRTLQWVAALAVFRVGAGSCWEATQHSRPDLVLTHTPPSHPPPLLPWATLHTGRRRAGQQRPRLRAEEGRRVQGHLRAGLDVSLFCSGKFPSRPPPSPVSLVFTLFHPRPSLSLPTLSLLVSRSSSTCTRPPTWARGSDRYAHLYRSPCPLFASRCLRTSPVQVTPTPPLTSQTILHPPTQPNPTPLCVRGRGQPVRGTDATLSALTKADQHSYVASNNTGDRVVVRTCVDRMSDRGLVRDQREA